MLRIMEIMITINSFYLVAFLTTVPLRAQMSNQAIIITIIIIMIINRLLEEITTL